MTFKFWSEIIYRLEVKVEIEYAKTNDDTPGKQNRWLKRNIINLTGGSVGDNRRLIMQIYANYDRVPSR